MRKLCHYATERPETEPRLQRNKRELLFMSDPVMGATNPETLSLRAYAEKAYLDYSV